MNNLLFMYYKIGFRFINNEDNIRTKKNIAIIKSKK